MYQIIKINYYRYYKSYDTEIYKYADKHNLKVSCTYFPSDQDWNDSPFDKPYRQTLNQFINSGNTGTSLSWNRKDHKIFECIEIKSKDLVSYWVQIDTTFLKKPILTFNKGKMIKSHSTIGIIESNYEKCPACNYSLENDDIVCPDCGLHLK